MTSKKTPSRQLGIVSLVVLAFSLPFELETPSINLGSFQLTNVEVLWVFSFLMAMVVVFQDRRWQGRGWLVVPNVWLGLLALYAAGFLISAILAPELRFNAAKAAARSLIGLSLVLITPQLVRSPRELVWVALALVAGGLVSAVSGLAEMLSADRYAWLDVFRRQSTMAGPFIRLSGTFNHANQAAMYIEATLPLLVALVWLAARRGRLFLAALAAGAGLLYLQAGFLTYSRTMFATIFLSNLIVAGLLWQRRPSGRRLLAYPWLATASLVVLLLVVNYWSNAVFRLRLSSEGDNEWYNARFYTPEQIDMATGEVEMVTVSVANDGALNWPGSLTNPVKLGGRWFRQADDLRPETEVRWSLDTKVRPGDRITMSVPLQGPAESGLYLLQWDLIQEGVVWFSERNGLLTASTVKVKDLEKETAEFTSAADELAARQSLAAALATSPPFSPPIPGRRTLWRVAARQFAGKPLLGIGLDNFRLTYGRVMDWSTWNDKIHSNNWYLETLVSLGVLGSLPFFIWLALLSFDIVTNVRNASRARPYIIWQIALGTALVAYLIHGLLDYFLLFNATAMLFWILTGLWIVQRKSGNK